MGNHLDPAVGFGLPRRVDEPVSLWGPLCGITSTLP